MGMVNSGFFSKSKSLYTKLIFWIVILSIAIIVVGLIFYFTHFNNAYSSASGDWANFATFNGYFLSIVNLIVLGYISFITYQTTQAFNRLQIRPLLFITLNKPEQIREVFKDSWFVNNGAKNAALNLIVRYTTNRNGEPFTKWVSCTSLGENQRMELFWIHWADKIEICFTDLSGERFYLFAFVDYNGHTIEINNKEYSDFLQQAVDNRDNNMTSLRDKLEGYINSQKSQGILDPMKDYTKNFVDQYLKH